MSTVTILGASAFSVGLIEGASEATALIAKVFSGVLRDFLGKRKALAGFGYALGALNKPLFPPAPRLGVNVTARRRTATSAGYRRRVHRTAARRCADAPLCGQLPPHRCHAPPGCRSRAALRRRGECFRGHPRRKHGDIAFETAAQEVLSPRRALGVGRREETVGKAAAGPELIHAYRRRRLRQLIAPDR